MTAASGRDELLELARLQMSGALDPVDEARLERLFRDATPGLQTEVVLTQEAEATSLTMGGHPTPSLRGKVLTAVAEAVALQDASLSPIAAIGTTREPAMARGLVAVSDIPTSEGHDFDAWATRRDSLRWQRSSALWRAASFVLAGGLLTSLYFFWHIRSASDALVRLTYSSAVRQEVFDLTAPGLQETIRARGPSFALHSAQPGINASAVVLTDPAARRISVVVFGGIGNTTLTLRATSGEDRPVTLGTIALDGTICGANFEVPEGIGAGGLRQFELVDELGNAVLLGA